MCDELIEKLSIQTKTHLYESGFKNKLALYTLFECENKENYVFSDN